MKKGKRLFLTASALAFLVAGTGTYQLWNNSRAASIVQMDVNPSIELHVDRDGDVLNAVALNEDAEKVLEGMKVKGADADTAVNAIVGSLLRHGYIDELANSILLTVEDDDAERGARLKEELSAEIDSILKATSLNAAIITQNMKDTDIDEQENISEGKATLIQNIVDANDTYKVEELAELSVNELNLIVSNSKNDVKEVATTGNAAEEAYIGKEEAKAIAFKHAGVKEADAREFDIDMDYEYGVMVYEVEFASGSYEYDYKIDATSGKILFSEKEKDDDVVEAAQKENKAEETTQNQEAAADIGKEEAKAIALNHAGITIDQVNKISVEKEKEDGKYEYHVEFRVGNKEYEYEISAETGKILDHDVEVDDDKVKTEEVVKEDTVAKEEAATAKKETTTEAKKETVTDIGREKAQSIALNHAGTTKSKVSNLTVEKEKDDGRYEYQVEFRLGNKEYDYEICAETGKILDYDVEVDDDAVKTTKKEETTTAKKETTTAAQEETVVDIGREKAQSIALNHAGTTKSKVSNLTVEKEKDDGRYEYQVEFRLGNKEYDYEICAETGKILDYDVEVDDDAVTTKKEETTTAAQKETTTAQEETVVDIGREKAQSIALNHAGTTKSKVSNLTVEKEKDDGRYEYQVEFRLGNKEYDYEICAETGKILDYDVEVDDDVVTTTAAKEETTTAAQEETTSSNESTTDIGKEKAIAIALEKAGLTETQIKNLEVEKEREDGILEYSVEFEANGKEYSVEINGADGSILDYEVEVDD